MQLKNSTHYAQKPCSHEQVQDIVARLGNSEIVEVEFQDGSRGNFTRQNAEYIVRTMNGARIVEVEK